MYPSHVSVLVEKSPYPTRKTAVVEPTRTLTTGVAIRIAVPVAKVALKPCVVSSVPKVAEVVLIDAITPVGIVVPAGVNGYPEHAREPDASRPSGRNIAALRAKMR
jgi:hypothetical protein